MSASAELSTRVRLSDPRPGHCAACFRGAESGVRFVDMDAAIDRGQVEEVRDGVVWHRDGIDDLHLCESCVREAMEVFALKPTISSNQAREIRRLERELDALRGYTKDLEATLLERPESLKDKRA